MRSVALFCLSSWLGAILFFGSGVVGHVFAVLAPVSHGRTLAADIVGRSLSSLHMLGLGLGVAFVIAAILARKEAGRRRHHLNLAVLLVSLMIVLTALSQFYVTPRIHSLRSEMGTVAVSELPEADMRRVTFERLHRSSTVLEALTFLIGLAAFIAATRESD
jgi:hypothetical protein